MRLLRATVVAGSLALSLIPSGAVGQSAVNGTLAYSVYTDCGAVTSCPDKEWLQVWDLGQKRARFLTPRPVRREERFDESPAWSPDGKQVAYVRSSRRGSGIYVASASGKSVRRILALTRANADWASFVGVEWSPDGRSVVFDRYGAVECSSTKPFRLRLTIAKINGRQVIDIPVLPRPITFRQLWHVTGWSPDGTRLLYSVTQLEYDEVTGGCREHGPEPGQLYTIGTDGRGRHLLANTDAEVEDAAWSPDNKHVAYGDCYYTESHGGNVACDLATVPADGSRKATTLTTADLHSGGILWSNKGDQLIANLEEPPSCQASITDCTSNNLFAINASNLQRHVLGTAGEILGASADGRYIATSGMRVLLVPLAGGATLDKGRPPTPAGAKPGGQDLHFRS
jgi:Tol biopolymer transport system component